MRAELNPKLVHLTGVVHSVEGDLRVVEPDRIFGFPIRRAYWIERVPIGATRGHHAHKDLHQAITLLRGRARVSLKTPDVEYDFDLTSPDEALIVPPGFWRDMSDFSADALMMVYASEFYDERDYIRDWNSYVEFYRSR